MRKAAKQSFAILMAVLMLFSILPLGVFAADTDTVKCGKCGASVTVTLTKEPTCTAKGRMSGTCSSCGATNVGYDVKALGHAAAKDAEGNVIYDEKDTIPAQCGVAGAKYGHCSRCGEKMTDVTEAIPALAHDWVSTEADMYLKNEECCIAPKTFYKHCKNCGKSAGEIPEAEQAAIEGGATFAAEGSAINPDKHLNVVDDPDPAVPAQAASCTHTGWKIGTVCKDCNRTVTPGEVIPKTEHVAAEGKEATCVSKAVCKFCQAEFGDVDPTNHKNVVADPAVPATCTETGLLGGTHCADCGTPIVEQKVQERLSPTGEHTYGDTWTYPAGYSCAAGGIITRPCTVCSYVEKKTIAAGDHVPVNDPEVPATCTTDGLTAGIHCAFCNTALKPQTTIAALGHEFKGAAVSNNNGTHAFHCTRCDAIGVGTEANASEACIDEDFNCICDVCGYELPHKFETYVSDGNATCLEDGTKTATCSVCKVATKTITDEGSHETGKHDFKYERQNDAGCLTNEHEIGTCTRCGKTETREINDTALGHDVSDWIYEPTFDCEVGGLRYKECKRCGVLLEEYTETVPRGNHTEVPDPAVPVTCTTDGKTAGSHCSVCGKVIVAQEVIVHEGHKATEAGFTVVKDPTCTEKGSKEATCSVCNKLFAEEIAALGHDYTDTKVAATCTKAGYTSHVCSRCGNKYTSDKVKALGHKMKSTVTPAQWGKAGKIVSVCSVCKTKVSKTISKIKNIKLSETTYVKDGKVKTPTVTVTDAQGKALTYKKDYKVVYPKGRKNLGSYIVTINFIGNYTGTKTRTFEITIGQVAKLQATTNANSAALSWGKVKYATEYVVYRATEKNGKYKKITTTSNTAYTVTKLNPSTVYYFKVKAVRTDKNGTFYGTASAPVKAKTQAAP